MPEIDQIFPLEFSNNPETEVNSNVCELWVNLNRSWVNLNRSGQVQTSGSIFFDDFRQFKQYLTCKARSRHTRNSQ